MFLSKQEVELNLLASDWVARLLFINTFLVIASYGIAVATGMASVSIMLIIKTLFLFFSIFFLLTSRSFVNPVLVFDSGRTPIIFCLLLLIISFFSSDTISALSRTIKFLIPFLYIYFSLAYLIPKYSIIVVLKGFHLAILIIYAIPGLSYIILGGNLSDSNIYGFDEESGQAFYSNHYGWASTLFILSFITVWKSIRINKIVKSLLLVLLVISILLLLSSANRASWLSLAVLIIPFFFTYKGLKNWHKMLVVAIMVGFIVYFLADPESSLNFAINKSLSQTEVGEARFEVSEIMIDYNNNNPTYWFLGNGLFDYEILESQTTLHGYHNSYWEILFGTGIPVFFVFLTFMFFRPLVRYLKLYSKYSLLIAPLIIIPFFESNLGGGQFLFFPWFAYMFLLNAKMKFWSNKLPFLKRIKHETTHPVI